MHFATASVSELNIMKVLEDSFIEVQHLPAFDGKYHHTF